MEEFAKKKGKELTRGSKQIAKENAETINFYRNMILGANGAYFLAMTLLGAAYHQTEIICFVVSSAIYIGCFQFMYRLGNPKTSEPDGKGTLLDPGLDLNMKDGMTEHIKDLIILTAFVQGLSLISNYFWLGLLLAPARALWMLWRSVISPWLFAPPPDDAVDEKKQKKLDRKMRRAH